MIQPTHIDFRHVGHRTLIRTLHKPWFIYFPFFWIKPIEVWYLGSGTKWYVLPRKKQGTKLTPDITDGLTEVPWYISKQLQGLERTQILIKHNKPKHR